MFQYQKGAIKTAQARRHILGRHAFQYQKGAIKTAEAIGASLVGVRFNTKKVRLKLPLF